MRRSFAVLAILALAVAGIAAADTIDLDGGAIQVGDDYSLICDDAVEVTGWGLETNTSTVKYVKIGDIRNSCFGNSLFVAVTDGAGNVLPHGSGSVLVIDENEEKVTFDALQDVASIKDLHVWIEGPSGVDID